MPSAPLDLREDYNTHVDAWHLVQKVHTDVYDLRVFLHYESCRHGVAMPPRDE